MDPVIRALERFLPYFATWWVRQSSPHQVALVVVTSLSTAVLALKLHDFMVKKAVTRVLEDQANVEAGPIVARVVAEAMTAAREQETRVSQLERQMRERLDQMEVRLIEQRVPLQILVNTQMEVETLRKYLDSRPPMDVRRAIDIPTLSLPVPERTTAYAHLLDEEPCPPKNRRRI